MERVEAVRTVGPAEGRARPSWAAWRRRRRQQTLTVEVASALGSALFCIAVLYAVWEIVCLLGVLPTIVLPTPLQVAQSFGTELATGDLQTNATATLQEALGGFALALVIASVLGYAIVQVRALELLISPFVAASQGVPALAIAPIIILLLGTGLRPKIVVCAAVVLFPLLVTIVTALRGVGRDERDVARVFGASRLQMLRYVELPMAAPVLLSGIKLGLTLSITGAVVAEFIASDAGLGFMLNTAINAFEVSTRYVALITLAALSATMYGAVTLLERIVRQWQEE